MSSSGPDRPAAVAYLAAGMGEVPAHDRWMAPAEAERIGGLRFTKRREEARLGRWTAKLAVAEALELGRAHEILASVVVRNAADGAPEVTVGGESVPVRISMTDRADWAVCAVSAEVTALGCDLELVEPRSPRFVADWFTPAEQELVRSRPGETDLVANLVWSAKESALKVLRTGLRRDTRSVEVSLGTEVVAGWAALSVATEEGPVYEGWWRRDGRFVLTCVGSERVGPPTSMIEPPPLVGASPGHGWYDEVQAGRP